MRIVRLILAWAALAAPLAARAAEGGPHMVGPCGDFGHAHQICGLSNPEDIDHFTGSPWLMVIQQFPPAGETGLAALNADTLELVKFSPDSLKATAGAKLDGDPACMLDAKPAFAGMGTQALPSGGWRVVIIYHGAPGMGGVALFDMTLKAGKPTLAYAGCVTSPPPLFLNDIAALPNGAFAATHMFDQAVAAKDPKAQQARYLASEDTGYVVRWSKAEGWVKVPNSGGSFPNGMAASADGKTLYYAETYGHRVSAIGLDGSGRRRFPLAMNPDNVTVAQDGSLIVAGGTGAPLTSTAGCGAFRPAGCGFPSAEDRVDPVTGKVTRLFAEDGTVVPGASVGVVYKTKLFVGGAVGDRITVVDLSAP
jgi:sugar lactone lactonase YvrE